MTCGCALHLFTLYNCGSGLLSPLFPLGQFVTLSAAQTRVSGADILKQLREDASKDSIPPPRSGTTRDGDGKANIWGVEPTENKQDAKDVVPIPLILSAVFGAAITFFLILPNLPFTNPDQL